MSLLEPAAILIVLGSFVSSFISATFAVGGGFFSERRRLWQNIHAGVDSCHHRGCPQAVRASPDFSPGDAMIAPDFGRQRVPATESIAVATVEGARAR